ncbi:AAA family ATPase [Klebsiella sp. BIGb0407]|uniref:AAA family ATPase n=1 Tax=Klebsiella sp. BIGb0407 TaxID=2940603 RepID=UPI002169420F|nr:AAA family ATPase [Klebsiella sp. BIGb0407]MCS3432905.1 putative ATP-binding protein involved in virulence [Klebsiella sp. BIGb0407]
MKVEKINIRDIGGIKLASLVFNPKMNVICGYNGVGKTTILECISHSFSSGVRTNILSRNATSQDGAFEMHAINDDGKIFNTEYKINHFSPTEDDHLYSSETEFKKLNIITLKIERYLDYKTILSINKDPMISNHEKSLRIIGGSKTGDFKSWFLNRYLYSSHEGSLTDEQQQNLLLAKKCFSILDSNYSFSRVIASDNEIMLNTPSGEIYFEYLSSGFKSCLAILFTIIKEIELMSLSKKDRAVDFSGIVIIDEPEIHLHPSWQSRIREILLSVFPNAQFICATHSPHIVQSCNESEVIALASNNGYIKRKSLWSDSKYGFKGWTIEEILSDVMGIDDVRTDLYKNKVNDFYQAADKNNAKKAKSIFNEIDKMLHPENMDRKILKMDLAMLTGGDHD